MRKIILIGASALLVCLGAAQAQSVNAFDQAGYTALSQQGLGSDHPARLATVRAATTSAESVQPHRQEATQPRLRDLIAVAFAALAIGVGAVGFTTIWIREEREYPLA